MQRKSFCLFLAMIVLVLEPVATQENSHTASVLEVKAPEGVSTTLDAVIQGEVARKNDTKASPHKARAKKDHPGTSPPMAPASVVSIDAVTGRLRVADPAEFENLLTEELRNSLSTSSADLFEIDSPTPQGGVMVNLQGRFRSVQWATRSADGSIDSQCDTGVAHPVVDEANIENEKR